MQEFAIITGITVGITQLVKGLLPSKWVPLTSVVLAIVVSSIWGVSQHVTLVPSIIQGLIAGLSANGLYDNVAAHTS